jgi:sec-independent protein translocase protein TatA
LPTSLGPAEILVILIVALIVLGPKKLPEAGRQVGKAIAEVRKWSQGFQDEIKNAMEPESKRPSYSEPQPGYQPPLPVIPAETEPPADSNGHSITTGSHGLISGPAPAETRPTDPSGPPAGDAPQP